MDCVGDSDDSVDEGNIFYFESDHLALRGNKDYCQMLKVIALLEAQKARILRQLEDLEISKKRYCDNPQLLLDKLKRKEDILPPNYCSEMKIPSLEYFEQLLKSSQDTFPNAEVKEEDSNASSTSNVTKVRGRAVDETKSDTFNQLWSFEEQRRLEQLLIEYPAEEVEMRRYVKIAKALGNRTPQQVSSRVQKYFQKLYDAGMPVPGRKPKNRRAGYIKPKHFQKPSTFFPAFNVPVRMPEDDIVMNEIIGAPTPMETPAPLPASSDATAQTASASPSPSTSAITAGPVISEPDPKLRKMQIIKAIREEKQNTLDGYHPDPLAAKCVNCQVAPVSRSCWYCNDCMVCVNLCPDCLVTQLLENKFTHLLHDVEIEEEL